MPQKDAPEECQYGQQGHGQICWSLNQYEYGLQGHGQMSELKSSFAAADHVLRTLDVHDLLCTRVSMQQKGRGNCLL